MNLLKRIKNLYELSNFKITEFDNKLVISKKDEKLTVNEYIKPAQIIKMHDTEKIINDLIENK